MERLLTDASFLISAIRSCDANHVACYSFFMNHEHAMWVVPTIAYFEYQAAQSRLKREGRKAYREIYIQNVQTYEVSLNLIRKTAELDLANLFSTLRGADLIYACIARIEGITLVTCDERDFGPYRSDIAIVNPLTDKK